MAILKNAELFFAKLDPKRPNDRFDKENPTWEVQARTRSKAQAKEWKDLHLSNRVKLAAGGGIEFGNSTGGRSVSSTLLDDYEEGTWTPVSDYGTLTSVTATYTKIGNSVFIRLACTMPSTSSSSIMAFAGLPFSTAQDGSAQMGVTNSSNYNPSILLQGTTCYFYGASAGAVAASTYSGALVRFTGQYNTTA